MENIILVIHLVIVVAMIASILVQRSSTDGLSGLSGGSGGNALFSVRGKANLLTRVTKWLAVAFICTSLALAYLATHRHSGSIADKITADKVEAPVAADKKPAEEKPAEPAAAPEAPLAN